MSEQRPTRVPIRRVGMPGQAWLDLQGSILVFHKQNWVTSSSLYIPVEWIQYAENRRRDIHRLWEGLLACLVACLFALPLTLLIHVMRIESNMDLAFAIALGTLSAFCLWCGLRALWAFSRRQPAITFTVQAEYHTFIIEFWAPTRHDVALQELLTRLKEQREHVRDNVPYPIRMNHMWYRTRPYHRAVLMGGAISLLLYLGMLAPAILQAAGYDLAFSNAYFVLAVLPPIGMLGMEAFRRHWPFGQPKALRKAVHALERGDLEEAAGLLESLLAQQPQYDTARALLVRVHTEQAQFDAAFRHCDILARRHPGIASTLQANLWAIRRIHERMEEPETAR